MTLNRWLFVTLVTILLTISTQVMANDSIVLSVPNFPPFTYESNGKLQGIGIELARKVFQTAELPYEFKKTSTYARAVHNIKSGLAEGFFLASQNNERDAIAVLSKPILINRWCWFLLKDSDLKPWSRTFKPLARVGTLLGTNTHRWLIKNGYTISGTPTKPKCLIQMIEASRINAIFLSEALFTWVVLELGQKSGDYQKIFQSDQPFGIYISKDYLSRRAGVMDKINSAIDTINSR